MRCYSCDRPNASHNDGATERTYCTTCWNVIEDTIGLVDTTDLTDLDRHVTLEELVEQETAIDDAIHEAVKHASDMP